MVNLSNIKYYVFGILFFVLSGLIFIAVKSPIGQKQGALLNPADSENVTIGKNIYKENCASCHGINLEGQPDWMQPGVDQLLPAPPHDETGHTWHHSDEILFGITKHGVAKFLNLKNYKTNMPAYENTLSDEEIIAVLSYIKSTWPEDMRKRHDEMNAQRAN